MCKITKPKLSARNKKLYVSFTVEGKQIRKSLNLEDTKRNRKIAETQLIPQLIIKANSGEFFNNKKCPTVDDFMKVSFDMHSSDRRIFTQQNHERVYRLHIKPYFGKKEIDKIKPSDIRIWQNNLGKKLAPATLSTVRIVFNTILKDAYNDELIKRNPMSLTKAPVVKEVRKKKPFTISEINQILEFINPKMKAYFAIGFYTGMRTGEIIGLKWSDINWKNKTISIKRAIREGVIGNPKTEYSIRKVDILDVLLPYLKQHKKLSKDTAEFVFETYMGKNFTTSDKIAAHYWKPCLKELGIEYRNLYQMRHSYASLMIENGENILYVSNQMGHKDSTVTLEKYAKSISGNKTGGKFFLAQN